MQECAKASYINDGWKDKITPAFAHLRRILTTLAASFGQNHGRVHLRAPGKLMPRAESLHREYLNYLVCGNDNVNALEYVVPYPLFSPKLNIVGS